jgi:hypothetical protein
MLPTLLLHLALLGASPDAPESLWLQVEAVPTEARLGDVLFVRISVHNRGDQPALAPVDCMMETGTLRLTLDDPEERTAYTFRADGTPAGFEPRRSVLSPGEARVLNVTMVRLPRLRMLSYRFWNPQLFGRRKLSLRAVIGELRGTSSPIVVECRPQSEMATLLEYYDGGSRFATYPADWEIYRPSLATFYLLSFPPQCSYPDKLTALEDALSEGSLRDLVHATRLTQAVYDAPSLDERRKATDALLQWVDAQPEIERQWLAMQIVSWGELKGLGEYCVEFIEHAIPRLPAQYAGRNLQDYYREIADQLRETYQQYRERQRHKP